MLPFTIGMSSIPTLRFQALNFIGAVIWSITIAAVGYLFGNAVEYVLGDLKRYEEILLAVLAFAGFAYWWYSRRRA